MPLLLDLVQKTYFGLRQPDTTVSPLRGAAVAIRSLKPAVLLGSLRSCTGGLRDTLFGYLLTGVCHSLMIFPPGGGKMVDDAAFRGYVNPMPNLVQIQRCGGFCNEFGNCTAKRSIDEKVTKIHPLVTVLARKM